MEARCGAAWAFAGVLLLVSSGRAEDDAAARKIIDEAIEAAGGREALGRYRKPFYQECKGKAYSETRVEVRPGAVRIEKAESEFTLKRTVLLPDKLRTDQEPITNPENGPFGIRFNGEKGFYVPAMKEMDAAALRGIRDRLYGEWVATLIPLDGSEFQLTALDEIMLDGRPAVGVKVCRKDQPDVLLYFDKQAMTLVKRAGEFNGRSFEGTYDDFAELNGLVYPKKFVGYVSGNKTIEMETTEFKFLDEVDEAIFEEP